MSQVSAKVEDNNLIISLSGRVDSNVAPQVEKDIFDNIKSKDQKVILDFDNLEYISSAGLRVILKIKKDYPEMEIINVSNEVYEILEMTGFTEIVSVKKQYRVVSVEGCEKIGSGANGTVYRLDPETIIKVYKNKDALDDIQRERELAREAFVLGIPTAIPYDVVKVGDLYGSVFELLNAKSFSQLIKENPKDKDKYVKLYVDLLKKIHSTKVPKGKMPDEKEVSLKWIEFCKDYLSKEVYEKALKLFKECPKKDTMLHGDYHTKNVLMQKGEVLLIDMDTLCIGNPVYEFASMYLAYIGFGDTDAKYIDSFMGLPHELAKEFFYDSVMLYTGIKDEKKLENKIDKARLVGYVRLLRRTIKHYGLEDKDAKKVIDNAITKINDLVNKVDSLDF